MPPGPSFRLATVPSGTAMPSCSDAPPVAGRTSGGNGKRRPGITAGAFPSMTGHLPEPSLLPWPPCRSSRPNVTRRRRRPQAVRPPPTSAKGQSVDEQNAVAPEGQARAFRTGVRSPPSPRSSEPVVDRWLPSAEVGRGIGVKPSDDLRRCLPEWTIDPPPRQECSPRPRHAVRPDDRVLPPHRRGEIDPGVVRPVMPQVPARSAPMGRRVERPPRAWMIALRPGMQPRTLRDKVAAPTSARSNQARPSSRVGSSSGRLDRTRRGPARRRRHGPVLPLPGHRPNPKPRSARAGVSSSCLNPPETKPRQSQPSMIAVVEKLAEEFIDRPGPRNERRTTSLNNNNT